jgi:hypothetical protein
MGKESAETDSDVAPEKSRPTQRMLILAYWVVEGQKPDA